MLAGYGGFSVTVETMLRSDGGTVVVRLPGFLPRNGDSCRNLMFGGAVTSSEGNRMSMKGLAKLESQAFSRSVALADLG